MTPTQAVVTMYAEMYAAHGAGVDGSEFVSLQPNARILLSNISLAPSFMTGLFDFTYKRRLSD
jgi:hypothetical protein